MSSDELVARDVPYPVFTDNELPKTVVFPVMEDHEPVEVGLYFHV